MVAPIFRTRSYVFCIGLEANSFERIETLGRRLGFRALPVADVESRQEGVRKTDHLVCVLVTPAVSDKDRQILTADLGRRVFSLGAGGDFIDDADLESAFQALHAKEVPKNFKKMAKVGLETAVASLSGRVVTFVEAYKFVASPEALFCCELVSAKLFLRGQIEFPFNIGPFFGMGRFTNDKKLVDYLKELDNLTMGVVAHNMRKLGVETRGGFPYFTDLRKTELPSFLIISGVVALLCRYCGI